MECNGRMYQQKRKRLEESTMCCNISKEKRNAPKSKNRCTTVDERTIMYVDESWPSTNEYKFRINEKESPLNRESNEKRQELKSTEKI